MPIIAKQCLIGPLNTINYSMFTELKVKKLSENASLPTFATKGSACFDIRTSITKLIRVEANSFAIIPTGLAFEVPEGYVMNVYSRSGHGFKHNVRLANCVGVIDSDYRGELLIKLTTDGPSYTVEPGDAIAQARLEKLVDTFIVSSLDLSSTERGTGGFGSTGA